MENDLQYYASILKADIEERKYESLRYSIFNDHEPQEYQTRIEHKEDGKFLVYSLADRASLAGKPYEFDNFDEARLRFLRNLSLAVEFNRERAKGNEETDYKSDLWK